MVSVWAYAYEYLAESLVSDHHFDAECLKIDLSVDTGNPKMDKFFRENFVPYSGVWVRRHPEQGGLFRVARMLLDIGGNTP